MCEMSKYPGLYSQAEWFLRVTRMSNALPGYELLKRAIVIWKVEGKMSEKDLLEKVEEMAPMAISKGPVVNNKSCFEQAMIEAIRSVSEDREKITISEFVADAVDHIF